jgi:hypothetical protein
METPNRIIDDEMKMSQVKSKPKSMRRRARKEATIMAAMVVVQGSVFAGLAEQFAKLTSEADKTAAVGVFHRRPPILLTLELCRKSLL